MFLSGSGCEWLRLCMDGWEWLCSPFMTKKSPPQRFLGRGFLRWIWGALEAERAQALCHDGTAAKAYTDNRRNFEPVDRK